ncbi:MAG TPA: serine hydrolase, partial [Thermoanaerobaculia bacterium]|nr:serine hydrolase [Thermoanaerobaculia bacterium]
MRLRTSLALALWLWAAIVMAAPAVSPETVAGIDRFLTETYPAAEPGAAVLVMKDGEVLLRKGYGMANLELGVPITPDMVFELGSVSKPFTATAILMLAERGKLSIEDDVTRHLPGFPTHGRKVTLAHLLSHTSGVPNFTSLPDWVGKQRLDLTVDELIGLFRGRPLDFEPGERYSYSNSGYVLLGAVIEKISGRTYEEFIEEEIFKPLGMTASRYGRAAEVIPGRVDGYEPDPKSGPHEKRWRNSPYLSMNIPYAAGALLSTLDDMARWDRAVTEGTLLPRAALERMVTPFRLNSGKPARYGLGWTLSELAGHEVVEHNGATLGFMSHMLRVPDERLLVLVMSNYPAKTPRVETVALRVAARALGRPFEEIPTLKMTAAELEDYVGAYRVDPKEVRMVTRDGDRLFVQRIGVRRAEVLPTAKDEFLFTDNYSRLRFLRDAQGRVTAMEVFPRGGPSEVVPRSGEPPPGARPVVKVDPALFDAYAGTYQLAPGSLLLVSREGDRLFVQLTGQ